MANYPQLDDCSGVWTLKEVNDAVMGGYWRNAGSRGLFAGGNTGSNTDVIDYITIATAGDAVDFGNLVSAQAEGSGGGNFTRSVFVTGNATTDIVYVTPTSTGNAADFGDRTIAIYGSGVAGNSTRLVMAGGQAPGNTPTTATDIIDYVHIPSTGNAVDFGNLSTSDKRYALYQANSPTRAIFAGGYNPTSDIIDYVEIATTGNATDFGNLIAGKGFGASACSSTRGVFLGGLVTSGSVNQSSVEFIEIASTGNAIDFGDLTAARKATYGTSNSVRGIVAGGQAPGVINIIESMQIPTGGTTVDFGDLTAARNSAGSASNAHGGLNDGYQGTRIAPIPQGGGVGQRALFSGGESPAATSKIDTLTISTLGNAADFGNLKGNRYLHSACSSSTRSIVMGGNAPADDATNDVESVQFASQGNGSFFSDGTVSNIRVVGLSNETRGISAGGQNPYIDVIEYITIASVGTDALDFGNLAAAVAYMAGFASTTRGVFLGGNPGSSPHKIDVIQYITIASTGNTSDFGDCTAVANSAGTASSTRGLRMGGANKPGSQNIIEYITIAATGNSTDFGDLTSSRFEAAVTGNSTRAIAGGGGTPSHVNTIDYVTIATTGDAADFGDLTAVGKRNVATSNGHGGLS